MYEVASIITMIAAGAVGTCGTIVKVVSASVNFLEITKILPGNSQHLLKFHKTQPLHNPIVLRSGLGIGEYSWRFP